MAAQPDMYRLVERDGILHVDAAAPSGFALERRQGGAGASVSGGGAAASAADSAAGAGAAASSRQVAAAATTTTTSPAAAATTTSAAAATTTTTSAPAATTTTTTSAAAETTTSAAASTTTETTTTAPASTTTDAASSSASSTSASDSASSASVSGGSDTTVTRVITPTTQIVVGTSTITSSLSPITSAQTISSSSGKALPASSGNSLSTGAIAGIAVGASVGGILALALLAWFCLGAARRRRDKRDADNILWPATGDSSALYPEPVHNTGRAGFGIGDDGDELDDAPGSYGGGKLPMSEAGAGAAGVGAATLGAGALGRYGSQREPQLPNLPPAVYASDYGHDYNGNDYNGHEYAGDAYNSEAYYGGGGGDASPPEGASAYTNQTPSQNSHSALAPGMAGLGYGGAAVAGAGGYEPHRSPSPPQFGGATSADGHGQYDAESQGGHMPFPGEPDHEGMGRSLSPRPMQVGDTFGEGYDETEGGKRWRLSVVNDDPLDRD